MTRKLRQLRPMPAMTAVRGLTMVEMVVAMTIIVVIMTGVVWTFVELLQSHDKARARMEATANARAAMEVLSVEIKRARNTTGTLTVFNGTTSSSPGGGDRVNQDGDNATDEEALNGADDDGDYNVAGSDLHAIIPAGAVNYAERPVFFQQPDLDDLHIDEDLGAISSVLEFDTFDAPGEPLNRRVRFYIGQDATGQPNTLIREVMGVDPVSSSTVATSGPICHNVVSFGALFWDHSQAKTPTANPWLQTWPPAAPLTSAPSSVYLTITVYAGTPYPYEELPANLEVETVNLTTVVNVEAVLADPTYVAQRLPITPVP